MVLLLNAHCTVDGFPIYHAHFPIPSFSFNPYYANQDLDFKIFSHIGKKQGSTYTYHYFYYIIMYMLLRFKIYAIMLNIYFHLLYFQADHFEP
jgi:hypothetical protein